MTGWVRPIPKDLPFSEQLMRPIFLVQIIFAGYMCCTSIFYFFNALGYEDFQKISNYYLVDQVQLDFIALVQRYYCLGHAAFATGILLFMNYDYKPKYRVEKSQIAKLLYYAAIITFPLSLFFLFGRDLANVEL